MPASATAGPWHVEDGALTKGNEQPTGWFICHPKTECDATALAWVEREADALMFAAAPDMLDALREAKGLADMAVMSDDQDGTPSDDQDALVRLRAKIDAAISKATSRQPEGER